MKAVDEGELGLHLPLARMYNLHCLYWPKGGFVFLAPI